MVFSTHFRKGLLGIEDERRRRAMADNVPVDDGFKQADTNWEVEAVVDEDQL